MSKQLSFGKYEGKTFEWIFFNAPWYAEFIYENRIHRQCDKMDEDEGAYFLELYRRARSLTGLCRQCRERPIRHLGLTWQRNGNLGMVGFYCDECEYLGGSATAYHPASFFVEAQTLDNCEQLRITKEIRRMWIGDSNLSQKEMVAFFHNDDNFTEATVGFFQTVAIPP
jgi:hypothetical protein